ncbi:MAG: protein kinase [Planctomycetes bacterium]|nr:protein kinase [Planctomycetota bacterium]
MLGIMNCIVEAVVAKGVKGLFEFVPGGPYLHDIGADVFKRHKAMKAAKKLEDDLKEMISAKADAALAAARRAMAVSAPHLPPREKGLLTQYLAGMPDAARQSMKRKEDPSGRSVAAGFTFRGADDIAKVLPQSPPRFVTGDAVPGLPTWLLTKRLGAGGFGEVWLTKHQSQPEQRAVKFCTDPAARHRLVTHEKDLIDRVMAAGRHPNIVPLLECDLSGDTPWLMYEFVSGGTLADVIPTWEQLPPADRLKQVLNALRTLASAVGHCHALNPPIVHRDLKPANVLVDTARRTLRVTDFGIGGVAADFMIAEETRGVSRVGNLPSMLSGSFSMLYASPQQRNGDKPDPRDDVHALGVIAYQMLTRDLSAAPGRDMDDDLRDAGAPAGLIELIARSVAQKADRRPRDANEWGEQLAALKGYSPASSSVSNAGLESPASVWSDSVNDESAALPAASAVRKQQEKSAGQKWVLAGTVLLGLIAACIFFLGRSDESKKTKAEGSKDVAKRTPDPLPPSSGDKLPKSKDIKKGVPPVDEPPAKKEDPSSKEPPVKKEELPAKEPPATKKDDPPKVPARVVDPILLTLKPGSFQGRTELMRAALLKEGGGNEKTEAAVAAGLKWLATQQNNDGSWAIEGTPLDPTGDRIGGTTLALLPFLGAGHTHKQGMYTKTVGKGIDYLLSKQKADGAFGEHWAYRQGLAIIVLCEAYAMTGDQRLKLPTQRTIDLIVAGQHRGGGWMYKPKDPGDTCVTGWNLMALRSAEIAGLKVPKESLRLVGVFLDGVSRPDGGYGYENGEKFNLGCTAVGLHCREHLGWSPKNTEMAKGMRILTQNPPPNGGMSVYYYYHATQALRHFGGDEWHAWNVKVQDMLLQRQVTDENAEKGLVGSWSPAGDEFAKQGGRLMVTSLSLLTLEVYYRHVPLFLAEQTKPE